VGWYEKEGLGWVGFLGGLGVGGWLGDDMGVGKRIELMRYVVDVKENERGCGGEGGGVLMCGRWVVGKWEKEIRRFGRSINVMLDHGGNGVSE
ncbi:SNF2-related protein, partial [Paenibacillus xylanexedens]|uniref:SNF2-related protein n=1 Tax=Paenibacillus xylanexedens TaxID=528191 RepID=UPI0034D97D72